MPVEISQSGGLTFRVTDSSGKVKFDINKKQPKVVLTIFRSGFYTDANANYIIHKEYNINGVLETKTTAVVQSNVSYSEYINVSPTNGFILPFIYFPNSGSQDNTNIVFANNTRIDREAMFLMPLGKWIPANGGKIIRHYFTQENVGFMGWSGVQLFYYNWTDSPIYNPSSTTYPYNRKYRLMHGIVTQCNSFVGNRESGGSYSTSTNGNPPAIFNMSGGINTVGTGTAKMKSTRCYMQTRLFICK